MGQECMWQVCVGFSSYLVASNYHRAIITRSHPSLLKLDVRNVSLNKLSKLSSCIRATRLVVVTTSDRPNELGSARDGLEEPPNYRL